MLLTDFLVLDGQLLQLQRVVAQLLGLDLLAGEDEVDGLLAYCT